MCNILRNIDHPKIHVSLSAMYESAKVGYEMVLTAICQDVHTLAMQAYRNNKEWGENKLRYHIHDRARYIVSNIGHLWASILLVGLNRDAYMHETSINDLNWNGREKMAIATLVEDVMCRLDQPPYNTRFKTKHEEYYNE